MIKSIKSVLTTLFALYIFATGYMYIQQRSFIFHPTKASNISSELEVKFKHDNETLSGWVTRPGKKNALLYLGGNAEKIENNIPFYKKEFPHYTTYFISYREYGKSTGKATEENLLNDALYIFDQISKNHENITIVGRSLGSGVASHVASHRNVAKAILVTPYDSIQNIALRRYPMLPIPILLKHKFESWKKVKKITAPTLILIAETDKVVPRQHTENLIKHFKKIDPKVVTIKDSNHGSIINKVEYKNLLKSFIN